MANGVIKKIKYNWEEKRESSDSDIIRQNESLQKRILQELNEPKSVIPELLQNADDAGCKKVSIDLNSERLIFINGPPPMKIDEIKALCDIGKSTKKSLKYIGHFGIGFKTVFSVTNTPIVDTGYFHFKFDKEDPIIPHLKESHGKTDGTVITLPFNIEKKNKSKANKKIKKSLEKIPKIITNLKNIESIQVQIEDSSENKDYEISKKEIGDLEEGKLYEIYKDGKLLDRRKIFDYDLKDSITENYLEELKKERGLDHIENEELKKEKIKEFKLTLSFSVNEKGYPCQNEQNSKIYCYFPTKINTYLPFDLQSEFIIKPDRNDFKSSELNELILDKLQNVYENVFYHYFNNGNYSFIDLLPSSDYEEVRENLPDVITDNTSQLSNFLEGKKFLKCEDGEFHKPANAILIDEDLKKLFTPEEIRNIIRSEKFLIKKIHDSHHYKKLIELDIIEKVDLLDFLKSLKQHPSIIKKKTKQWFISFYSYLYDYYSKTFSPSYDYYKERKKFKKLIKKLPIIFVERKGLSSIYGLKNKLFLFKRDVSDYEIFLEEINFVDKKLLDMAENGYLFNLNGLKYREDLEEGAIDSELKQEFEKKGYDIEGDTKLSKNDENWYLSTNKKKEYIIESKEEELNIYEYCNDDENPKSLLFLKEILDIKKHEDKNLVKKIINPAFDNLDKHDTDKLIDYTTFIFNCPKKIWNKAKIKILNKKNEWTDLSNCYISDNYNLDYNLEIILQNVEGVEFISDKYLDETSEKQKDDWGDFFKKLGANDRVHILEQEKKERKKFRTKKMFKNYLKEIGVDKLDRLEIKESLDYNGMKPRYSWVGKGNKYAIKDKVFESEMMESIQNRMKDEDIEFFIHFAKMIDKNWNYYKKYLKIDYYYCKKTRIYKLIEEELPVPSELARLLKEKSWMPNSEKNILKPPGLLFIYNTYTKDETDIDYVMKEIENQDLIDFLDINTRLTIDSTLNILENIKNRWAVKDLDSSRIRKNITYHLTTVEKELDELEGNEYQKIIEKLKNIEFVFVEEAETKFRKPDQVFWKGNNNLGDFLVSISSDYKDYKNLFVEHIGIREELRFSNYLDYYNLMAESNKINELIESDFWRDFLLELKEEYKIDREIIDRIKFPTLGKTFCDIKDINYYCKDEGINDIVYSKIKKNTILFPKDVGLNDKTNIESFFQELKLDDLKRILVKKFDKEYIEKASSNKEDFSTQLKRLISIARVFEDESSNKDFSEFMTYTTYVVDNKINAHYELNGEKVTRNIKTKSVIDYDNNRIILLDDYSSFLEFIKEIVNIPPLSERKRKELKDILEGSLGKNPPSLEPYLESKDIDPKKIDDGKNTSKKGTGGKENKPLTEGGSKNKIKEDPKGDEGTNGINEPKKRSRRITVQENSNQKLRKEVKQKYSYHCQICLSENKAENLAPEKSYVDKNKLINRTRMIEAHHMDKDLDDSKGNFLILCKHHHRNIQDLQDDDKINLLDLISNLKEIEDVKKEIKDEVYDFKLIKIKNDYIDTEMVIDKGHLEAIKKFYSKVKKK